MQAIVEYGDYVTMYGRENKPLSLLVSRVSDDRPFIDILPFARYLLRVKCPPQDKAFCTSGILLTLGLLVTVVGDEHRASDTTSDVAIRRMVVTNLSDKSVRLFHGQVLSQPVLLAAE